MQSPNDKAVKSIISAVCAGENLANDVFLPQKRLSQKASQLGRQEMADVGAGISPQMPSRTLSSFVTDNSIHLVRSPAISPTSGFDSKTGRQIFVV